MIETTIWNKITEGESDENYPYCYALVAVQEVNKVSVHVGCYFRQYEQEQNDDFGTDWGDYNEAEDQYYCPKGWYQEMAIFLKQVFSSCFSPG